MCDTGKEIAKKEIKRVSLSGQRSAGTDGGLGV